MVLSNMASSFVEEVEQQVKEEEKGNTKAANKHADKIYGLANKFKELGSEGKSELINLAKHSNPYVRLWAACNLDESAKEFAREVLTSLAQHTNEKYGQNAQIHLDYNM
ncbi:hypothetical protein P4679_24025 [Priestia megaterium]|uniref:hypothetical protein n=1 Tax=Priestia megaterium TaxID=1404 RepID=UPI002E2239D7|nr:hypothetical protein [Priestia megaterium]